jgi:hypothetical protein
MSNSVPIFVQVGGEMHQIGTASVLGYDVILKLAQNGDSVETFRAVIEKGNVGGLTILPVPHRGTPM